MNEFVLHYVWQFKLFSLQELITTDGDPVEVIDTGLPNSHAGPDFFNAKIKIANTIWAGNVEIHKRSSDWFSHRHNHDKTYNSVILHVVGESDKDVFRTNGEKIPQVVINIPEQIKNNYKNLLAAKKWIPCEDRIHEIPAILMSSWQQSLLVERLERKSTDIAVLLDNSQNHLEEIFYISLARSFGFGVNSDTFELLAKSLSLSILGKHKDMLFQLEALLFGQAGFLSDDPEDDYHESLIQEYHFLRKKFNLNPLDKSLWRMLRLRPDNFPHIRIAQFAALLHQSQNLLSKVDILSDLQQIRTLFSVEVSPYWKDHYRFGPISNKKDKPLGVKSIDTIIINTVVPFLFILDKKNGKESDRGIQILENIPPESNSIITNWKSLGQKAVNAFETQALLQLTREYCEKKRCIQCRIGHKLLSSI